MYWFYPSKFESKDRIVDLEGNTVGFDYKGHKYRIIEKRERIFSTQERVRRGFVGIIAVVSTLFFGLKSKSVRNLFTKTKENVRFGVFVPPYKHVTPSIPIDIAAYEALGKAMEQEQELTLYDTDETEKHTESLSKVLGHGGSKKAFQISQGRALLLPNMDTDPTEDIAQRWERIVLEEVEMSKILNRLGLKTLSLKQVSIRLGESSENKIPAYISETFESLSLEGCFIIDTKNEDSSPWKKGEHFLFQSEEDRFNQTNWDLVFDSALTDIAKLCLNNIPVPRDALNLAIKEKPSDSAVCQHEVRYFGFDFSFKDRVLNIPDTENSISTPQGPSTTPNIEKARSLLKTIVDHVFYTEFGIKSIYEANADIKTLRDVLLRKYFDRIQERMSLE